MIRQRNTRKIPPLGAVPRRDGTFFRVWAPAATTVSVRCLSCHAGTVPLGTEEEGYFSGLVPGMRAGEYYLYRLDDRLDRPDPVSRSQPQGVHGPSQVVDPSGHHWQDSGWKGLPLTEYITYELHVGTFSPEGNFSGVAAGVDYLCDLGITAVELMPVAQFPGTRNWGYDGVYPFAVQASYGGYEGLKALVDLCHRRGLAVALDVVYNHLGPEGNYLHAFGPYFTDRYRTPWGEALNLDGPGSEGVRDYLIANALFWIDEFHIDALRLDAVHGIFDNSAWHILEELSAAVHQRGLELGRRVYVIAESDRNDSRLIRAREEGGYGLDVQWNDDFHHALHALVTGERRGYYQDFGKVDQLVAAFAEGYVYCGEYSAYRQRRQGNDASDIDPCHFIVCAQNHDQVGNRKEGDRLTRQLDLEQLKLAAGTILLSPYLPLLFMGEEYGETAPFQYFVSHGDAGLIEAVRQGREAEFAAFHWEGEVPDPCDEATFIRSRINPDLRHDNHENRVLYRFYRALIALRKATPSLGAVTRGECSVRGIGAHPVFQVMRTRLESRSLCLYNFSSVPIEVELPEDYCWQLLLDSSHSEWGGAGEANYDTGGGRGRVASYGMNPTSLAIFLHSIC